MKLLIPGLLIALMISLNQMHDAISQNNKEFNSNDIMIRVAEIEIDSTHLEAYISALKEESEASVRIEPGVIAIYPMFQRENPTQIRILEIYAGRSAYESHLKTPHFQHYKTATMKMVKSLKLIDMEAIDMESMPNIFRKLEK